jgi:hypothetical protein
MLTKKGALFAILSVCATASSFVGAVGHVRKSMTQESTLQANTAKGQAATVLSAKEEGGSKVGALSQANFGFDDECNMALQNELEANRRLKMHRVIGDGSCALHAVAWVLYETNANFRSFIDSENIRPPGTETSEWLRLSDRHTDVLWKQIEHIMRDSCPTLEEREKRPGAYLNLGEARCIYYGLLKKFPASEGEQNELAPIDVSLKLNMLPNMFEPIPTFQEPPNPKYTFLLNEKKDMLTAQSRWHGMIMNCRQNHWDAIELVASSVEEGAEARAAAEAEERQAAEAEEAARVAREEAEREAQAAAEAEAKAEAAKQAVAEAAAKDKAKADARAAAEAAEAAAKRRAAEEAKARAEAEAAAAKEAAAKAKEAAAKAKEEAEAKRRAEEAAAKAASEAPSSAEKVLFERLQKQREERKEKREGALKEVFHAIDQLRQDDPAVSNERQELEKIVDLILSNGTLDIDAAKEALKKSGNNLEKAMELLVPNDSVNGDAGSMTVNAVAFQELYKAFQHFDDDNDGKLRSDDLRHYMTTLGEKFSGERADEMISESPMDDNGLINYEQFAKMLTTSAGSAEASGDNDKEVAEIAAELMNPEPEPGPEPEPKDQAAIAKNLPRGMGKVEDVTEEEAVAGGSLLDGRLLEAIG